MKKINTNTFRSILEYLALTKKSNIINTWLLGINSAILIFLINSFIEPSEVFKSLISNNIYFKSTCLILFVWLSINVILLIIYSYKEKVVSLTIEDKYYRLKAFISYMDNIENISEDELLDRDIFEIEELTDLLSTKKVIKEYTDKIIKHNQSILKWANKRFLIYRIVILVSIPLLLASSMIVFSFYN